MTFFGATRTLHAMQLGAEFCAASQSLRSDTAKHRTAAVAALRTSVHLCVRVCVCVCVCVCLCLCVCFVCAVKF